MGSHDPLGAGTALVTGASSGIGAEFARQLAGRGLDLVLVARRRERLAELAAELRERHGVKVDIMSVDLANEAGIRAVEQRIALTPDLVLLVNNAGFGVEGDFVEAPPEPLLEMVRLHVEAPLRLVGAAVPVLAERGGGGIVNVSSVAAFIDRGGAPVYSGTKAFLNTFTGNLRAQLAGRGIAVQALCPGYTATGFHAAMRGGDGRRPAVPGWMWSSAADVVARSLAELDRDGRLLVVPGLVYRVSVLLARLGLARVAGRVRRLLKRRAG